jgi:hypothetical protein
MEQQFEDAMRELLEAIVKAAKTGLGPDARNFAGAYAELDAVRRAWKH